LFSLFIVVKNIENAENGNMVKGSNAFVAGAWQVEFWVCFMCSTCL